MKLLLPALFFFTFAFAASAQQTARGVGMSIFPNPTIEFFTLSDATEPVEQVVVYNLVGKKVKEFRYAKSERYYVADLPKSIYMIQLLGPGEKVVCTQKLDKR